MRWVQLKTFLTCIGVAALSACDGGSTSFVASLPPAPAPPPPAKCPPECYTILPGMTANMTFATVGYESRSNPSDLTTDGFSVKYDAATGEYQFDLPATGSAYLSIPDGWQGDLIGPDGNVKGAMEVLYWSANAQYTALAAYRDAANTAGGFLAFGVPTPQDAVPATGTASYGVTLYGSVGMGDGLMSFDFAKGDLSGYFDLWQSGPYDNIPMGHFDFASTVSAVGSGRFSGQLVNADLGNGLFEGSFTGPHGEELMGRFQAPVVDPYTGTKQIDFGVFAGSTMTP